MLRRFRQFHRDNPEVCACLARLSREARSRGAQRFAIATLWEVMRWEWYTATSGSTTGDPWKLNNNYRSLYARQLMEQEPDLADFFETRKLRAA